MENLILENPSSGTVAFCPMEVVVRFLRGKWRPRIVWRLGNGEEWIRFGELKSALPGITEKILIGHLRELERMNMVARTDYESFPPRVEYGLTDFGRTILPLFETASDWVGANRESVGRVLDDDLGGSFHPCVN